MNNMLALFDLGGSQILLIMALILIFFGARRIPELAKGLGQGIKEFKKATREVTDEIHNAAEAPQTSVSQARQLPSTPPAEKPATVPQAAVAQSTEQKA
ncbi:Sec-independent protein translocase protein TatA (modular protein) [Verrucomicrobia bacterium]|nr:Sec-independent protein translocase protein TatA (modular protein) [Verrucomicrobiota bacterium]